jgi:hypothetical protein
MNDDNIIAASPIIPADGATLAHRIVIRDLGDEYVVHCMCFDGSTRSFNWGYYVRKKDQNALAKAWANFERRARRTLNLAFDDDFFDDEDDEDEFEDDDDPAVSNQHPLIADVQAVEGNARSDTE